MLGIRSISNSFFILEHLHIYNMYACILEMEPKFKHEIHLCFIYILYTQTEGNSYTVFRIQSFPCSLSPKVRCGIFQLRHHIGAQHVSDFGPFWISGFWTRDTQTAAPSNNHITCQMFTIFLAL
jgi:hypothetical protein